MHVTTTDTLAVSKALLDVNFSADQAEALAELIAHRERDIVRPPQLTHLATRADLQEQSKELTTRIYGACGAMAALIIAAMKVLS